MAHSINVYMIVYGADIFNRLPRYWFVNVVFDQLSRPVLTQLLKEPSKLVSHTDRARPPTALPCNTTHWTKPFVQCSHAVKRRTYRGCCQQRRVSLPSSGTKKLATTRTFYVILWWTQPASKSSQENIPGGFGRQLYDTTPYYMYMTNKKITKPNNKRLPNLSIVIFPKLVGYFHGSTT